MVIAGHARAGRQQHLRVCAAVSILTRTLRSFYGPGEVACDEEGNVWSFPVTKRPEFEFVLTALIDLARSYPANITFVKESQDGRSATA